MSCVTAAGEGDGEQGEEDCREEGQDVGQEEGHDISTY